MSRRAIKIALFSCCFALMCQLVTNYSTTKPLGRLIHIPALGIGPQCNGCPPRFCDDDPAIIYGYCCGCARFFDNLPVICSTQLKCPPNAYDLCREYEYMMYCCC